MRFLLTIAIASSLVHASELKAPDPTITASGKGNSVEIRLTAPAKHHINAKAPLYLEKEGTRSRLKPASVSEREAVFSLAAKSLGGFTATVYLCDDKNTFCEVHKISAEWRDGKLSVGAAPSGAEPAPRDQMASAARPGKDGFFRNAPEAALLTAKREKKPLLIDFFGIWCPPCNMLDEEVFSSSEFRKLGARFVRLKLDADAEVSWELKSKFKIGGYPTVLFASSEGEEISRVVGFRPVPEFVEEMRKAWASRELALPALRAKAETGDGAAASRLGRILLERREFEEASKFLSRDAADARPLLEAEIGLLSQKKTKGDPEAGAKLAETLEKAIARFPSTPESIDQRMKLAQAYDDAKKPEKKKPLLLAAIETARDLIEHPERLRGEDYAPADLWATIADARSELGEQDAARDAWKKAAAEYLKKSPSDRERGYNLELAYSLWKSGDLAAAERIYSKLQKHYPGEFTYFYAHASMLLEERRAKDALPLAEKAFAGSYGDNRLRSANLLAKLLKEAGRAEEAKKLIKSTLENAKLPSDESIRTHRYAKTLRELDAKL